MHDINFHRGVAAASGNPDRRVAGRDGLGAVLRAPPRPRPSARSIATCATPPRRIAQIYQAIRARDVDRARRDDERSPAPRAVVPGEGTGEAPRFSVLRFTVPRFSVLRFSVLRFRPARGGRRADGRRSSISPDAPPSSSAAPPGIGRALALGLADAGADVVATGRRPDAVDEVSAAIEARGRRTLRHPADVGELAALQRPARRVPRGVRPRRHRRLRRRHHQARRDARDDRGRLERDPRHQRHRHVPRPIRSSRRR